MAFEVSNKGSRGKNFLQNSKGLVVIFQAAGFIKFTFYM